MPQLDVFIRALTQAHGDAVVLHQGEPPAALMEGKRMALASAPLTAAAMDAVLNDALPPAARVTLQNDGTVEHTFQVVEAGRSRHVTVFAISKGADRWVEIRLRPAGAPTLEPPNAPSSHAPMAMQEWLAQAAARGASTLYLSAHAPIFIRVNGRMQRLNDEIAITPERIERSVQEFEQLAAASGGSSEGGRRAIVSGVGDVECRRVRDHRGPGAMFFFRTGVPQIHQLAVPERLYELCRSGDGLVLLTGPAAIASLTMHALIDRLNSEHAGHIVTLETSLEFQHQSRCALVNQRPLDGPAVTWPAALRQAVDDGADVIAIGHLDRWPLDAVLAVAGAGVLVLGTCEAVSTMTAIERLCAAGDDVETMRGRLAQTLIGAFAGRRVRTRTRGQTIASECLVVTPAVGSAIRAGDFHRARLSLECGEDGMVPLTATLAALVERGDIDVQQAYRLTTDAAALAAALRTSSRPQAAGTRRPASMPAIDLTAELDAVGLYPAS